MKLAFRPYPRNTWTNWGIKLAARANTWWEELPGVLTLLQLHVCNRFRSSEARSTQSWSIGSKVGHNQPDFIDCLFQGSLSDHPLNRFQHQLRLILE